MNELRTLAVLLLAALPAFAGDWPQWLGPNRDATTTEKVAAWKDAPKVLWRRTVGEGNSGPVVVEGRVFLHTKVKDKNEEEVAAFDAATGKEIWRQAYPRAAFSSLFGNGPRATPAVSDGRVFSFGITGVLSCFDARTGKLAWQVDTLNKFQAKNLLFGMSCSPLVAAGRALVSVGAKGASIVAFDVKTGEVAWQCLDDKASYASPSVFVTPVERQAVFLTVENVVALNPADGAVRWKYPFVDALQESSATPARAGDLLLASSITTGTVGLRTIQNNGASSVEQVWKNPLLTSYFSTPVSVGKHVYMVAGTKPPALKIEATLYCLEAATGKVLWSKPKVGQYHASLLRTGDEKLLMLDDSGNVVLLQPNPEKYEELARSKICGHTWAHPALANGRFYVRDDNELVCVQLGD
jgi:outer membrane protein assembly factor BamB